MSIKELSDLALGVSLCMMLLAVALAGITGLAVACRWLLHLVGAW